MKRYATQLLPSVMALAGALAVSALNSAPIILESRFRK